MPERSDRHGWIDLLVPDGPFLSAAALDVQTVGENWPTRLSAEQRSLLTAPPASEAEEGEGWDDTSWDGRRARVTELLTELLGYREGKTLAVASGVVAHHHIYRARVSADFAIHAPDDPDDVRMVVMCGPDATDDPTRLDPARTHTHDGWVSTPVQRAALLARQADADLALVTNGCEHLLVNVVTGTTGSAIWTVNGLEDRHARDAFVALLHKQRVLHRTVPLPKLIELSQDRQHELTDTLGKQVRRAAEALVNAISRANRTSRGRLLEGLTGQQVYAATTRVLMRTVFLLVAEERGLLPVADNQLFADQYAMSTLLDKLEEDAYRNRSAMERRAGAWQRMMALSRAVHAGIEHDDLRLPAYGGNLFDPDEHPFLEARVTAADGEGFEQLGVGVVDDFTVLTVLRHLQVADGQRISFRSLDVEQIGHVYEALLDHSAVIVPEEQVAVLGLIGRAGDEPEVSLVDLEGWTAKSDGELGKQLVDLGVAAEARGVYQTIDDGLAPDSEVAQTLNVAVANDSALRERVERYAPLLRTDARGIALVFRPGDVYVTETSSKRDSGTAYTPRSLADEIAKHTLDPLIYDPGPQNEPDESEWKLKTPAQILDLKICDPAVGSAAILVAAVRYLAEALLQARVDAGELSPEALASGASDVEAVDARVHARRAIVSRCAYGVDRDPMAVEMAKLSLWLITMARDEPFTFLDHAIRHGDSLLGINSLEQLRRLHLDEETDIFGFEGGGLFVDESVYEWRTALDRAIERARTLRLKLLEIETRELSDVARKAAILRQVGEEVAALTAAADAVVATCLSGAQDGHADLARKLASITAHIGGDTSTVDVRALMKLARDRAEAQNPTSNQPRKFLHWPLVFPEVFCCEAAGFDAMLGNPPFLGGTRISGPYGVDFRQHIARWIVHARTNRADLVAFFFRRAGSLVSEDGTIGFLATKTLSETATRDAGLDALKTKGWSIYRAVSLRPWPGRAGVDVVKVWMVHGSWRGAVVLDGEVVSEIGTDLNAHVPGMDVTRLKVLEENRGRCALGIKPRGNGFVLEEGEAAALLEESPQLAPFVKRYATGSDITRNPDLLGRRFVIDASTLSIDELQERPELLEVLRDRVYSYRMGLKSRRLQEAWWKFEHRPKPVLSHTSRNERVLVAARVAKYPIAISAPGNQLFNEKVVLFLFDDWGRAGILFSSIHGAWVDWTAQRMRQWPVYDPKAVFNPFPMPSSSPGVGPVAEAFDLLRRDVMEVRGIGLTKLYDFINDTSCKDADVIELRRMQDELDSAVFDAYGWSLASLKKDFVETPLGKRYQLTDESSRGALLHLCELNASAAEVAG